MNFLSGQNFPVTVLCGSGKISADLRIEMPARRGIDIFNFSVPPVFSINPVSYEYKH